MQPATTPVSPHGTQPCHDVRHLSLTELASGLQALPPPPEETGTLAAIVCRRSPGVHENLESVCLSPEEGVPGDEWNRSLPLDPAAQLTAMRGDVGELIACGQPLAEFGDNLIVDLDLSVANLPVGSRLRVGHALVEVSPKPHNGCSKFQRRFGSDALRFVNATATRHLNLRGIYWRVIEGGEVRVNDAIRVISRPGQDGNGS